jgi:hypothetical protein
MSINATDRNWIFFIFALLSDRTSYVVFRFSPNPDKPELKQARLFCREDAHPALADPLVNAGRRQNSQSLNPKSHMLFMRSLRLFAAKFPDRLHQFPVGQTIG